MGGWVPVESQFHNFNCNSLNFSYIVKVATFGHKHHQITPSNHAFQMNSKISDKGVSVPSIPHNLPNL